MSATSPQETWKSKLGFVLAAVGSAVGLANIWRFPYVMGQHGGGAFLLLYALCLVLLGLPMLYFELWCGCHTKKGPWGTMRHLLPSYWGRLAGALLLGTGLCISAFYSLVIGWILYYLSRVLLAWDFSSLTPSFLQAEFQYLLHSPYLLLSLNAGILCVCYGILRQGVVHGIEEANKWMMPVLLVLLVGLVVKGLSLKGGWQGMEFVFSFQWEKLTPASCLMALGQAFFTLSLGQGTMITYGAYLPDKKGILALCLPVVLVDTLISLLSALAVFSLVFSYGLPVNGGEGLLFSTLPLAFKEMPGGAALMGVFLLMVLLAALSSQISVLEPLIFTLRQEKNMPRLKAVNCVMLSTFLLGIPLAYSFSSLHLQFRGLSLFDGLSFFATSICVPLGALMLLASFFTQRFSKKVSPFSSGFVSAYLRVSLMWLSPLLIGVILISGCLWGSLG